jgi:chromosome segregation ATPase
LIEQAMFFLAGLLAAGLVGLIILPAFARRSARLSAARARMFAPLSEKDAAAERDLLRAEHAVVQYRLERNLASLQDAVGRHRADLGRQATTMTALEGALAKMTAENAALQGELAQRNQEILSLQGENGASQIALNDFAAQIDRAAMEIASLRQKRIALETLTDEQRTIIAGLETRAGSFEIERGDAAQLEKAEHARLSADLAARTRDIGRLEDELKQAMSKGAIIVADLERKEGELRETRRQLSEAAAATSLRARAEGPPVVDGAQLQGDLALREIIARLAADIVRLSGTTEESPRAPSPGKNRRRASRAPSSQTPDAPKGVGSAKTRQLQPTAPER